MQQREEQRARRDAAENDARSRLGETENEQTVASSASAGRRLRATRGHAVAIELRCCATSRSFSQTAMQTQFSEQRDANSSRQATLRSLGRESDRRSSRRRRGVRRDLFQRQTAKDAATLDSLRDNRRACAHRCAGQDRGNSTRVAMRNRSAAAIAPIATIHSLRCRAQNSCRRDRRAFRGSETLSPNRSAR